jgi:hypothetical protein
MLTGTSLITLKKSGDIVSPLSKCQLHLMTVCNLPSSLGKIYKLQNVV